MEKSEIFRRLNEITSSYSFIYILAKIVVRDFCGPIDILFSKNTREHLNHNEFSFLVGLWLKNVKLEEQFNQQIETEIFEEIYLLMEELHKTFLLDYKYDPNNTPDLYELFSKGSLLQETMFYGGTGAYDEQYLTWTPEKYKYDLEWLKSNKCFDPTKSTLFYNNIKNSLQARLNDRGVRKIKSDRIALLHLFCLTKKEITQNQPELEGILQNLVIDLSENNNANFNEIGDFNLYTERPIIKISEKFYFIPSTFPISESLYESPYYWMIADKKYTATALKNRGNIAEEIVKMMILPVFGKENIYSNVLINRTKNDQVTDIDILATYHHKAIIFQIKSKKLTALSKKGDDESIKNDFKKAVNDAFNQAQLSKKCLLNFNDFKFPSENNDFPERVSKILEYNIVTVVLDDYPAITHQVHILLGNKTEELPVAVNIFDLELICRFLPKPEQFIDYIARRTKFSKYYKADNEMSYLGFHLKKGLNKYKADMIGLDESWAQAIDRKFYDEIYKKEITLETFKKIQRNDLCFCGSKLKYKKCHGKK